MNYLSKYVKIKEKCRFLRKKGIIRKYFKHDTKIKKDICITAAGAPFGQNNIRRRKTMTEREKCDAGRLYYTGLPQREQLHEKCADLCHEYNLLKPSQKSDREKLLRKIFGKVGANPYVEPTLSCGFGFNIEVGDNFFANNNCVFVDPGKIIFGDNVCIAPCCGFYTAGHPIDAALRAQGYEYAYPIHVGSDVWIGGHTVVLPGVNIGNNVVIGAGSVVTSDIPDGVVAYGNPCRVARLITEADRHAYDSDL